MKYLLIILALFTLSGCGEPAEWTSTKDQLNGLRTAYMSMPSTDGVHAITISCMENPEGKHPFSNSFIANKETHTTELTRDAFELYVSHYGEDKYAKVNSIEFPVGNLKEISDNIHSYCRGN